MYLYEISSCVSTSLPQQQAIVLWQQFKIRMSQNGHSDIVMCEFRDLTLGFSDPFWPSSAPGTSRLYSENAHSCPTQLCLIFLPQEKCYD